MCVPTLASPPQDRQATPYLLNAITVRNTPWRAKSVTDLQKNSYLQMDMRPLPNS